MILIPVWFEGDAKDANVGSVSGGGRFVQHNSVHTYC